MCSKEKNKLIHSQRLNITNKSVVSAIEKIVKNNEVTITKAIYIILSEGAKKFIGESNIKIVNIKCSKDDSVIINFEK